MARSQQEPWFFRAWQLFYDGWNFSQFLSAMFFGAWASVVTGVDWSTPLGPWLFVLAGVLVGIALVRIARKSWNWLRVMLDRPHAIVEIETETDKATMEIGHFGAPVTFSAEGRVVRALDESLRPKPTRNRFQCELQLAEGKPFAQRVTLQDGEWAHIVLADHIKSDALLIRRGTFRRRLAVADSGVELEITIKTEPSWPIGTITRRINVTRDGNTINAVAVDDGSVP